MLVMPLKLQGVYRGRIFNGGISVNFDKSVRLIHCGSPEIKAEEIERAVAEGLDDLFSGFIDELHLCSLDVFNGVNIDDYPKEDEDVINMTGCGLLWVPEFIAPFVKSLLNQNTLDQKVTSKVIFVEMVRDNQDGIGMVTKKHFKKV
jgi:hypothetical protein